ncbi:MAG: hypothetical protein HC831_05230 [Chloroflexia bacterium]|nr:hypothetical protein [Chloroflexia bacterium]
MKTRKNNFVKVLLAISVFVLIFSNNNVTAQSYTENYNQAPYLGLGLGINDYGLGVGLEIPLNHKLNTYGNIGVGGWGYKMGVGLSYFPRQAPFGGSFNIGYSHALGFKDFETELEVASSNTTQKVLLDLEPVGTINLFYTYSWTLGRTGKFSLSGGYAIPLEEDAYEVKTQNVKLSSTSKQVLEIMQPGGFILGLKFMFRI